MLCMGWSGVIGRAAFCTYKYSSFARPANNPAGTVCRPHSLRPLDRRTTTTNDNNDRTDNAQ